MKEQCFVVPSGRFVPIDMVRDGVGVYSGQTLEEVQKRSPGAVIMDYAEAEALHRATYITPPVEITEEEWWYFLEVLPPCSWTRRSDSESFFMSEFTSGDVTLHLVRVGSRYFKFEDHVMKNHDDRVKKCLHLLEEI